jgi:hypothetical protein
MKKKSEKGELIIATLKISNSGAGPGLGVTTGRTVGIPVAVGVTVGGEVRVRVGAAVREAEGDGEGAASIGAPVQPASKRIPDDNNPNMNPRRISILVLTFRFLLIDIGYEF